MNIFVNKKYFFQSSKIPFYVRLFPPPPPPASGTLTDNIMRFACCRVLDVRHDEQAAPGALWKHLAVCGGSSLARRIKRAFAYLSRLLMCGRGVWGAGGDGGQGLNAGLGENIPTGREGTPKLVALPIIPANEIFDKR